MKVFKTNSKNISIKGQENKEITRFSLFMFEEKIRSCFYFGDESNIQPSSIVKMMVKTQSGSIYTIEKCGKEYVFKGSNCDSRKVKNVAIVTNPVRSKEDFKLSTNVSNARLYVCFGTDWITTSILKDVVINTSNGTFYGMEHLQEYKVV